MLMSQYSLMNHSELLLLVILYLVDKVFNMLQAQPLL